jgi:hypothetical protein
VLKPAGGGTTALAASQDDKTRKVDTPADHSAIDVRTEALDRRRIAR